MSEHLAEEQFCALLLGETPSAETAAHLAVCGKCRREVGVVSAATANFNELGGTWAHAESMRQVQPPSRFALRVGFRPAWKVGAATAACVVAIGLGSSFGHLHRSHTLGNQAAASASSTVDVAQDNRLCQSIDDTLRSGSDTIVIPVSELRRGGTDRRSSEPKNVVVN